MKIIIVGCGRVGALLARRMLKQGYAVSVVDKDSSAFKRLGEDFTGRTVVGLGFDDEILCKAGIEGANALVAITGGDNSNIMTAQIATVKYNIPSVYARVKDPLRAEVYREMGVNTVCNTLLGAGIFEDAVTGKELCSVERYLGLESLSTENEISFPMPSPAPAESS